MIKSLIKFTKESSAMWDIFNKKNNTVRIDKKIKSKVKIIGNNNFIDITCNKNSNERKIINIRINGNNNKIIIKNLRTSDLKIEIGNLIEINNATVEISDNFVCSQASILAYQNNVPIKIGENCLFSSNITIRSGEIPHAIYDKDTFENFDVADGVYIGNHVWVGEHCYIMKRAKIPDNSVIGAMSVVTKEFEEKNVLIAGNPAKICKKGIMWNENASILTK